MIDYILCEETCVFLSNLGRATKKNYVYKHRENIIYVNLDNVFDIARAKRHNDNKVVRAV